MVCRLRCYKHEEDTSDEPLVGKWIIYEARHTLTWKYGCGIYNLTETFFRQYHGFKVKAKQNKTI